MPLKLVKVPRSPYWHARGTVCGLPVFRSTGTASLRAAHEALKSIEDDAYTRATGKHSLTFDEAAVSYIEAGGERRYLEPVLRAWAHKRVSEIVPADVRALAVELYPDAKASTRNRQVIAPVSAVINHAADNGRCQSIRIKRFKEAPTERAAVTREWLEAFDAHAPAWLGALAWFLFQTGTRVTEALNIRWRDVDVNNARIARGWAAGTKNGEPDYAYPSAGLMARLVTLRAQTGGDDNDRVFQLETRWGVYKHWRRACSAAGIKYVPPHQAGRHSMATELLTRQGVDVPTVQKLGNWKSPQVLLKRYAHAGALRNTIARVFGDDNDNNA